MQLPLVQLSQAPTEINAEALGEAISLEEDTFFMHHLDFQSQNAYICRDFHGGL